jgi:hypothetical protein
MTRARAARTAALGGRLAFVLLVAILPFRARSDVIVRPASSLSSILADLVVYAIDVLVVATLVLWLLGRAIEGRRIDLGPRALRLPALAIVGLAWLTIPFGVEPGLSVVGAARITVGAVLALYVINEVNGLGAITLPIGVMLAIQGSVAVAQAVTGGSVGLSAIGELALDPAVPGTSVVTVADGTRILRAYGLSTHPNVLGGALACGVLILMAASTRTRAARLAQAGVLALAAAALVVTFSRGAWLGAAAGIVAGLAIVVGGGRDPLAVSARRWVVAAVVIVGAALATGWLAGDAVAARTWLDSSVAPTEQRSIDERVEQIRLGWEVLLERPLTGAGASALPLAMRQIEPDFPFALYSPHLVPLAVAAELGVAGGVAYLWLMAAPWVLLAGARRRWTAELAGASAALAALTIVSLFDDYPWVGGPGRTLAWLVVGLWAMAWLRAGTATSSGSETSIERTSPAGAAGRG